PDVDLVGEQGVDLLAGGHLAQLELHFARLPVKAAQVVRELAADRRAAGKADPDQAAFSPCRAPDDLLGPLGLRKRLPRLRDQQFARFSEGHLATRAREEGSAKLL